MKTIKQIFKERYGHTFDITPAFEGAFLQVAKDVAEEYSEQFKNKWIDVYDRLPETEGDYLVCLHNNELATVHFYFDEDTNSFNTYGIKYWMPLPEPPSDKSGTAESA